MEPIMIALSRIRTLNVFLLLCVLASILSISSSEYHAHAGQGDQPTPVPTPVRNWDWHLSTCASLSLKSIEQVTPEEVQTILHSPTAVRVSRARPDLFPVDQDALLQTVKITNDCDTILGDAPIETQSPPQKRDSTLTATMKTTCSEPAKGSDGTTITSPGIPIPIPTKRNTVSKKIVPKDADDSIHIGQIEIGSSILVQFLVWGACIDRIVGSWQGHTPKNVTYYFWQTYLYPYLFAQLHRQDAKKVCYPNHVGKVNVSFERVRLVIDNLILQNLQVPQPPVRIEMNSQASAQAPIPPPVFATARAIFVRNS